ncbi:MAG: hypothetical protein O3A47_08025 [Chloroflexi bacterium]|nr:hypothetical protein [Chloroflexota bacterium]
MPERTGDETLEYAQVWTYLHAACALALVLYHAGQGGSERFWEVVEEASAVASLPRTSPLQTDELPEVELSSHLVESWLRAKLARRSLKAGESEGMLTYFRAASRASNQFDGLLLSWNEGPFEAEDWIQDRYDDLPGTACLGIGYHLILH